MEIAAVCGMSESEFWDCTPRYLSAKVSAAQLSQRIAWEQARYISFHAALSANFKRPLKSPLDLGRFAWEERPTFSAINAEEYTAFSDEADEVLRITNPTIYAALQAAKEQDNGK